jgi:hypothetical protein
MPITWKNVNQQLPDPAQLLRDARTSFGDSFKGVGNTLTGIQTGLQDADKQVFLDRINQFRTPEELQQAQDSGQLDALTSQFKYLDREVARNAPVERINNLRKDYLANQEYADKQLEINTRGLTSSAIQAALSGNTDEYNRILSENEIHSEDQLAVKGAQLLRDKQKATIEDVRLNRENDEYAERVNRKLHTETAYSLRDRALNDNASAAAGRAQLVNQMTSANIPQDIQDKFLQNFDADYQSRYGLTQDQQAEVDAITQKNNKIYSDYEKQYPVNTVFSFTDPERKTLGEVTQYIQDTLKVDDDGVSEGIGTAIDLLQEKRNIADTDNTILGALSLEAAKRTGVEAGLIGGLDDFNYKEFQRNLVAVYDEYKSSEANRVKLGKQKDIRDKGNAAAIADRRAKNLLLTQRNR